ncbi:hypothetical protein [Sulfuricurvum sp.]|uniref:hypothetical protein n=1 Tax=Sulfuricurvum sp. TaxID=2025608 RepID=UPI002624F887|nr:hypothetical protein [Sulfuricurvum sp.]MDD2266379.1 hypothetical protein [Sulfuricurvum sp.]MDD2782961.1 hypothetical protein [Sulfuricurvum sp.]
MKYGKWIVIFSACLTMGAFAQDAVETDGDKYKVILENEKIRVLEYNDKPGDKTHQHHHPAFMLYALEPFKRKLTFPNGKQVEREFKKGEVIWMEEQVHVGENTGKTDTHVLIVEMKPPNNISKDAIKAPVLEEKWKEKTDK